MKKKETPVIIFYYQYAFMQSKILYIFILSTNVTNNCIIKGLLSIAQCS